MPEETDLQMGITIDGRHYTVGKAARGRLGLRHLKADDRRFGILLLMWFELGFESRRNIFGPSPM